MLLYLLDCVALIRRKYRLNSCGFTSAREEKKTRHSSAGGVGERHSVLKTMPLIPFEDVPEPLVADEGEKIAVRDLSCVAIDVYASQGSGETITRSQATPTKLV